MHTAVEMEKLAESDTVYANLKTIQLKISRAILSDAANPNIPTKLTDPNYGATGDIIPSCVNLNIDAKNYDISGVIVVEKYGFIIENSEIIEGPISKNKASVKCPS